MLIKDEDQWKGKQGSLLNPDFWDLKLRAQLGRDLRAYYENTMKGPLPENRATLLGQLEQRERGE